MYPRFFVAFAFSSASRYNPLNYREFYCSSTDSTTLRRYLKKTYIMHKMTLENKIVDMHGSAHLEFDIESC